MTRNQSCRLDGREPVHVTKVLYVEHDDDNLYMLKMRLERVGDFEVLAVRTARRAASWQRPNTQTSS